VSRTVRWGGLHNTRDLGGLPIRAEYGAGSTKRGRIYRSARLDGLDAVGWTELVAGGVTTLIDLRNPSEIRELPLRPAALGTAACPVEDELDDEFMTEWRDRLGSPDYYPVAVSRWPGLFVSAFSAVADAPDGGVLIHCSAGRDRTGLVAALLLDAAGVERDAILDDYVWSVRAANDWLTEHPLPHETAADPETLESRVADARSALTAFLDDTDRQAFATALAAAAERLTR
jgi:protein-tyrosine phosphatase